MKKRIGRYFSQLGALPLAAQVTGLDGRAIALEEFFDDAIRRVRAAHAAGNTLIFIGNGGSAAIASHMAIDFTKNGGIRAVAMNDASALTCLSNDLGYERVFAKQIEMHARAGDVLIAISSSGNSENILCAWRGARQRLCRHHPERVLAQQLAKTARRPEPLCAVRRVWLPRGDASQSVPRAARHHIRLG